MKARYKFWYATIFSILILNACKKDGDMNSKELSVFIKTAGGDVHVANLAFRRTPLAVSGDSIAKFPAYLTREINSDVLVNISIDESLVSNYNSANKTNYILLPAANYKIVGSAQLTIPAGSVISTDSLRIQLLDRLQLNNDNGYLLPLSISEISGKDKGAKSSDNYRTVYVVVKSTYTNISDAQLPLTGTFIPRTGWVPSVGSTTAGSLGPAMLDGINTTAWRSSSTSSFAAKWLTIDMGAAQQIKGFVMVPNYVATTENATAITVSTSTDNVTWTVQGAWKGTGPAATSSVINPDLKNINFIVPVQARYFRFDVTASNNASRVGIAELNVVQ
ncbi:DUF1735 domain-containing protein [Pedobacter sp. PLR]|uniref:BT_3987 domain-containing protein n=1 Tax=Pedobacter sp. PLR TaxID=2994465 RepID=UPI0022486B01|nr:DUF1735 domain-containing protein [Pedobacter sp. PLR]MCX2451288.1 DUF1735 domain-containing protein [Pedobacter sp. PLR]